MYLLKFTYLITFVEQLEFTKTWAILLVLTIIRRVTIEILIPDLGKTITFEKMSNNFGNFWY